MTDERRPRGLAAALAGLDGPGGRDVLIRSIGGVRGLVDSSLPSAAFLVGLTLAGLAWAVSVALGAALLLAGWRLARRQPVQQALAGLVGVAGAALVAYLLHSPAGFFLPGIALNGLYAVLATGSVLARHPFVGHVAALLDPRLAGWRGDRRIRRAAALASLIWAVVFASRVLVQLPLYLHHRTGTLAVAKLALGWPPWAVATGATYLLLRRAAAGRSPAGSGLPGDPGPAGAADQEAPSNLPS